MDTYFPDQTQDGQDTPPARWLGPDPLTVVDLSDSSKEELNRLEVLNASVVVGVIDKIEDLTRLGWGCGEPFRASGHRVSKALRWAGLCDVVLVPQEVAIDERALVYTSEHAGAALPAYRPWVAVADIDGELDRIADRVRSFPFAAVTLVQVLRAGPSADIARDLLVESLAYSTLQAGPEHSSWLSNRGLTHHTGLDEGQPVLLHRQGSVLTVTLERPRVKNAYSAAMRDRLHEALHLAMADPTVEDIQLFGSGTDFCSGGDLEEFGTGPGPCVCHMVRSMCSPALDMASVSARVTVHLHGACVGAGIELPALAGRVFATADTRIRLPEITMGLIPGAGGTASLPRRIGRHRTAWLALTGDWLSAPTALSWGLIDAVEPVDRFSTTAQARPRPICSHSGNSRT